MKKKRKMTAKRKLHHKKNSIHTLIFILILLFILAGLLKLTGILPKAARIASDEKGSLQIGTFSVPSAAPTSTSPNVPASSDCAHDTGFGVDDENCNCVAFFFQCKNNRCARYISVGGKKTAHPDSCVDQPDLSNLGIPGGGGAIDYWCGHPTIVSKNNDGKFLCMGKPVIYLYPEKLTLVDVSIKTSGQIVVSDPLYPAGGWMNVLAHPNGKLEYQGKSYRELFYESNVKDVKQPDAGITLDSKNVRGQLDDIITKLGLIKEEKIEFLDWWVPKLQALNSPYVQFSIIEKSEKEKIDHVSYNPEPQTRIEFIAYFKPLLKPYEGAPLKLPEDPPKRVGFTTVEWGGILDDR